MKPIILLLLCFSYSFALCQNSTTTLDDKKLLTLNRKVYKIGYPQDWRVDTSKALGADLFLYSPKGSDTDKFSENINVMIENVAGSGLSLDSLVSISEKQILNIINDPKIIETVRLEKKGAVYRKLVFTGVHGIFKVRTEQYYFLQHGTAYVVTFSSEIDQYNQYKQVGEAILNSFTIM